MTRRIRQNFSTRVVATPREAVILVLRAQRAANQSGNAAALDMACHAAEALVRAQRFQGTPYAGDGWFNDAAIQAETALRLAAKAKEITR